MATKPYDLELTHWKIDLSGREYANTVMGKLANKGWFGRCLSCASKYEIKAVRFYIENLKDTGYMSRVSTMDEWWGDGLLYPTQSFEVFFENKFDHDDFVDNFLPSLPTRTCYIFIPVEEYESSMIKNKRTLNHMLINHSENDYVIVHTEQRNDLVALKLRWS